MLYFPESTGVGSKFYVTKLYEGNDFISVIPVDIGNVKAKIDILMATMWFTAYNTLGYFNSHKVIFLFQIKADGFIYHSKR